MCRRMSPLRVIGFVRVVVADHCPRKTRLQRCRKQGKVLRRWWLSDHADATDPRGASFLAQKQLLGGAGATKLLSGNGCGCSLPCDFRYTKWRQKGRQSAVASNCPRDVTCVIKMTSNVNPPACNPETLNTTAVSVHTGKA